MKEAFESIKKGLNEAIDFAQGKEVKAKVNKINPQLDEEGSKESWHDAEGFCAFIRDQFSHLKTLGERDRKPHGPALILLNLVEKDPKTIFRLLEAPA